VLSYARMTGQTDASAVQVLFIKRSQLVSFDWARLVTDARPTVIVLTDESTAAVVDSPTRDSSTVAFLD